MAKPKTMIVSQFVVDGKILQRWVGKRVPKWMKLMAGRYKGIQIIQEVQEP